MGMMGMQQQIPVGGMQAGGDMIVEVVDIPDSTVGLVIGRGGEQITTIQQQSACRVQMAPDSNGTGVRQCTLQGSRMSVEKAKMMINEVVNRAANRGNQSMNGGGNGMPSFGNNAGGMGGRSGQQQVTHEMLIPGPKCGLIIGKGGETIKALQEQTGVKMVMIQENQESSGAPKPLKMVGDMDKVENARRIIEDIVSGRSTTNDHLGGGNQQSRFNAGGGHSFAQQKTMGEVIVPRASVGMIIGKGGDTIKRLAQETGAKIQFKPDDEPSAPERCAVIQGTPDQIQKATALISDLVQKSGAVGGTEMFYMHVPSNKTGLVIGKGGETIKQICGESGAHVELSREPPPNASEKVFLIKGTPYQIHHAQHIIRIKVGDVAPGTPVPHYAGQGGPQPMQHQVGGAGNDMFGSGTQGHYYGNGGAPQQYGGAPQMTGHWNNSGQPFVQSAEPNNWMQQQQQPYYGQQQGAPQQIQPKQNFPVQVQPAYQQPAAVPAQAAVAAAGVPGAAAGAGQTDYSAQWAEYYRSLGMMEQANMIESQLKQRGGNAPAPAAGAPQQNVQYQVQQY